MADRNGPAVRSGPGADRQNTEAGSIEDIRTEDVNIENVNTENVTVTGYL